MFILMIKEAIARPNIVGNRSMPVHTYRWKDVMCCEDKEPLLKYQEQYPKTETRIEERVYNR